MSNAAVLTVFSLSLLSIPPPPPFPQAIYLMTETDPERLGDAPIIRTKDIFDKMDLNSDGVLSKEEFVKGCLSDETLYKLLACSNDATTPSKDS